MDIHRQLDHRRSCEAFSWIHVNLKAIQDNYRAWSAYVEPAICSAVLKANAYGLGAGPVGQALFDAGCRHFFVAYLDEALMLLEALREKGASPAAIPGTRQFCLYILDGPFLNDWCETVDHLGCIPILNSLDRVETWNAYASERQQKLPAALHIDTGLRRLGLPPDEYVVLKEKVRENAFKAIDWLFWMSHPVASSIRLHEANNIQLERVRKIHEAFPNIPFSYADTDAVLLGKETHFQMVRIGIGHYGFWASHLGLRSCLTLGSVILQIQEVGAQQGIGYDWEYYTPAPQRIATLACGYADGIAATCGSPSLNFYLHGQKVPVLGRISMDLCVIDVTSVPEAQVGDPVEIIGPHVSMTDFSAGCGVAPHKILTGLGDRPWRFFTEDDELC